MKTKLLASIGCLLLMAAYVRADALISFNDNNNADAGPAAGTYSAGDSFTFDITLSVTNTGTDPVPNLIGYSLWFETSAANNSYFTITNRTLSTFTDPNTPGLTYPQHIVAGGNENDLGGTGATQLTNNSYMVMSITIKIDASTPAGTYTIFSTTASSNPDHSKRSVASDSSFASHPLAQTAYTITVVPEPATLSLLGLGSLGSLGLTMLRARRKG